MSEHKQPDTDDRTRMSLKGMIDYGNGTFVHKTASMPLHPIIGKGTKVWHFSHIDEGAEVGDNCIIGQGCYIAGRIGNGVSIQNNVSVYRGISIENDVFLGPSCVFTNVTRPRSECPVGEEYEQTVVKNGATIGANATILCGIVVGAYALVGAGAVVTKDVPAFTIVAGVPARKTSYICKCGKRPYHHTVEDTVWLICCTSCGSRYQIHGSGRDMSDDQWIEFFDDKHKCHKPKEQNW